MNVSWSSAPEPGQGNDPLVAAGLLTLQHHELNQDILRGTHNISLPFAYLYPLKWNLPRELLCEVLSFLQKGSLWNILWYTCKCLRWSPMKKLFLQACFIFLWNFCHLHFCHCFHRDEFVIRNAMKRNCRNTSKSFISLNRIVGFQHLDNLHTSHWKDSDLMLLSKVRNNLLSIENCDVLIYSAITGLHYY